MLSYLSWILLTILYSPIFYKLYRSRWEKIDYTHAYFILPLSLWLVWRKRTVLKELICKITGPGAFLGLALFCLGLFMFVFGWRQDYLFISTLSLVPVLYGLIIYLYGNQAAKILSFPILYLLLLVPPPLGILDSLTLPMRQSVTVVTELILKTLHYPVARNGLLLSIAESKVYMGPACSGFRSLITMISLGLVYAYMVKGPLRKKLMLVSAIIPLALFGNLARVVSMCLVTFYFGEKTGAKFHDLSGLIIFVILTLGLIVLESLIDKSPFIPLGQRGKEGDFQMK